MTGIFTMSDQIKALVYNRPSLLLLIALHHEEEWRFVRVLNLSLSVRFPPFSPPLLSLSPPSTKSHWTASDGVAGRGSFRHIRVDDHDQIDHSLDAKLGIQDNNICIRYSWAVTQRGGRLSGKSLDGCLVYQIWHQKYVHQAAFREHLSHSNTSAYYSEDPIV